MFLDRHVKELMVPITDCSVTSPTKSLSEAVMDLRQVFCEVETGKCTEAGHRTSLVVDDSGKLVGILDFRSVLQILIPELAGTFNQRLQSLGLSIAFAEADAHDYDEAKINFVSRVKKNSETKVSKIMLKLKGENVTPETKLIDALKLMHRNKVTVLPVFEGEQLVGVIRDSDLFLATAGILSE